MSLPIINHMNGMKVYILRNPHAATLGKQLDIFEWHHPTQNVELINPVFFLHGVEYLDIDEVLKDFVLPFERAAGTTQRTHRDFVILSWDSRLIRGDERAQLQAASAHPVSVLFSKYKEWPSRLKQAEHNACDIARMFAPFYIEAMTNSCAESYEPPLAITHSLGGYLWGQVLKELQTKNISIPPVTWWNFQPAMPTTSFGKGGEFESIVDQFRGPDEFPDLHGYHSSAAQLVLWYSRFDFILATLYRKAKGTAALGQIGINHPKIRAVDVTLLAGEAHGKNKLFGSNRCFFTRVAPRIRAMLKQL